MLYFSSDLGVSVILLYRYALRARLFPFHGHPGFLHAITEFVFIFSVSMDLYRMIPGIDMPFHTAVVLQISRGAHKGPGQMHQLAEREISDQNRNEE